MKWLRLFSILMLCLAGLAFLLPRLSAQTASAGPTLDTPPVVSPIDGINGTRATVQSDGSSIARAGTSATGLPVATGSTTSTGISATVVATQGSNLAYLPFITSQPAPLTTTMQMGLAFVSSAESPAPSIRYERAASAGATINRWPMYWPNIELDPIGQPRVFNWAAQDANVIADINHDLAIDAILMLTPPALATGGSPLAPQPRVGDGLRYRLAGASAQNALGISSVASPPQGLNASVFADGTDTPGPGKSINPDNRWAVFVNAAVNRYKPGGVLAQAQGWGSNQGIRDWEIWNEEDLDYFFSGTPADYARLLKVAYLSARHADPQAHIILGGLAHFEKPYWLDDVLNVIDAYPDRAANSWFMDAVASHNYAWAWNTFGKLYGDRSLLDQRGLTNVKLWLTETGVPVWNDYPGPTWAPDSPYRATMSEQADFVLQTMTYAAWLNTEAVFWFQLYDDSGNGCEAHDAHGLVRNLPTAICNQSDGSTRPSYAAYQLAAQQLSDVLPYWRERRNGDRRAGNQEIFAFKRPSTGERVVLMWTRYYTADTVFLTATGPSALLMYPDGTAYPIYPTNGTYVIPLPAATNHNTSTTDGSAPIGGSPRILIEKDPAVQP